jgi:hypothetical protein
MLKRTVRHLAVTGITIVSATMLTALGAAVASAAEATPPPVSRPPGPPALARLRGRAAAAVTNYNCRI